MAPVMATGTTTPKRVISHPQSQQSARLQEIQQAVTTSSFLHKNGTHYLVNRERWGGGRQGEGIPAAGAATPPGE
jgi:hypothetical protein